MKKSIYALTLSVLLVFSGHALAVSDQMLERFAVSVLEINEMHQEFQHTMQQASPQEQEQVREQLKAEATNVIKDQGLSVEEYNELSHQLQNDPEMTQRFQSIIQDVTQR